MRPKRVGRSKTQRTGGTALSTGIQKIMIKLDGLQVCAIGLSGQMHGMVATNEKNEVVRRAILWNDQRTGKQCDEITTIAGGLTGCFPALTIGCLPALLAEKSCG